MKHIKYQWFGIAPQGLQNSIADLMRNSKVLYRRNLTDAFSKKTAITQWKICLSHCYVHLTEPLRPGSISFGKKCSRKQSCKNLCEKVPYWTAVTGSIVSSSEMTTDYTIVSAFNFTTNL